VYALGIFSIDEQFWARSSGYRILNLIVFSIISDK
jgi:hypothetical protein